MRLPDRTTIQPSHSTLDIARSSLPPPHLPDPAQPRLEAGIGAHVPPQTAADNEQAIGVVASNAEADRVKVLDTLPDRPAARSVRVKLRDANPGDSIPMQDGVPLATALQSLLKTHGCGNAFKVRRHVGRITLRLPSPDIAAVAAKRVVPALADAGYAGAAIALIDAVCNLPAVMPETALDVLKTALPHLIRHGSPVVLTWAEGRLKFLSGHSNGDAKQAAAELTQLLQNRRLMSDRLEAQVRRAGIKFESESVVDMLLSEPERLLSCEPGIGERLCDHLYGLQLVGKRHQKLMDLHLAMAAAYAAAKDQARSNAMLEKLATRQFTALRDQESRLEGLGFTIKSVNQGAVRFHAEKPTTLPADEAFPTSAMLDELLDYALPALEKWPAHNIQEIHEYLTKQVLDEAQRPRLDALGEAIFYSCMAQDYPQADIQNFLSTIKAGPKLWLEFADYQLMQGAVTACLRSLDTVMMTDDIEFKRTKPTFHFCSEAIAALAGREHMTPEEKRRVGIQLIQHYWIQQCIHAMADCVIADDSDGMVNWLPTLQLICDLAPGDSTALPQEALDNVLKPLFHLYDATARAELKENINAWFARFKMWGSDTEDDPINPRFSIDAIDLLSQLHGATGAAAISLDEKALADVGFLKPLCTHPGDAFQACLRAAERQKPGQERDELVAAAIDALPSCFGTKPGMLWDVWRITSLERVGMLRKYIDATIARLQSLCDARLRRRLNERLLETIVLNIDVREFRDLFWRRVDELRDDRSLADLMMQVLLPVMRETKLTHGSIAFACGQIAWMRSYLPDYADRIGEIYHEVMRNDPKSPWKEDERRILGGDRVADALMREGNLAAILQHYDRLTDFIRDSVGVKEAEAFLLILEKSPDIDMDVLSRLLKHSGIVEKLQAMGRATELKDALCVLVNRLAPLKLEWYQFLARESHAKALHDRQLLLLQLAKMAKRAPACLDFSYEVVKTLRDPSKKNSDSIRDALAEAAAKWGRPDIVAFCTQEM